jgi:hypothetical protein
MTLTGTCVFGAGTSILSMAAGAEAQLVFHINVDGLAVKRQQQSRNLLW